MIAYVRGTLVEKEPTRIIVEAAGVGYELIVPVSTFDKLGKTGETVKVLAHHSVREDDETLYGFATEAERELFLKLTSVSGVGPKIAIAILSGSSVGELSLAIANNDAKRLAAVKGVGRKTAEKICVELKDKVDAIAALGAAQRGDDAKPFLRDAVLALGALGFSPEAANKMVSAAVAADPTVKDAESLIRMALAGR